MKNMFAELKSRFSHRNLRFALSLLFVFVFGMSSLFGTNYRVRNNVSGNWEDEKWQTKTGSWNNVTTYPTNGDTVFFDGGGSLTLNYSVHLVLAQTTKNFTLTVKSGATLEIDTLKIESGSAKITIILESGATLKLKDADKKTGSLDIQGAGNLDLSDFDQTHIDQLSTPSFVGATITPAVWTGAAANNDWSDIRNWSGITAITQLQTSPTVTIPSGATPYPVATSPVTLDGKLIVESGASVTFADCTLDEVDSPNGTFYFTGSSITFNKDSVLNKVYLDADATITGANLTIKNGIEGKDHSLEVNVTQLNAGPIGTPTDLLKDLTINAPYIGYQEPASSVTPIYCSGDIVITDGCQFHGDITGKTFSVGADSSFLSGTSTITTTGKQTYTGNYLVATDITFIANSGAAAQDIEFTGTVNNWSGVAANHKSITIGSSTNPSNVIFKDKVGNNQKITDITVNGNLTANEQIQSATITVSGTSSLQKNITTTGAQTYTGAVTLTGGLTFLAGTAAAPATVTFGSTLDSDTTSKRSPQFGNATIATKVVFVGDVGKSATAKGISNLNFYGPVTLTGAINVSADNWNNNNNSTVTPGTSTVTVTGDVTGNNTFHNLEIAGTGTSNISGANTINKDFTCTAAGKTLIFGANQTQTISGEFTITGTAASQITLNSSDDSSPTPWKINVAPANAKISYAQIKNSTSTNEVKAINSIDLGNNTKWIFNTAYVWTGATDTDWTNPGNWKIFDTDGSTKIAAITYPGANDNKDDIVNILTPDVANNYPVYSGTTDISIKQISIGAAASKVTIDNTGNITLTAATSPITNMGTVIFQNTGRFLNSSATPIMDITQGTVEYSGSADVVTNYSSGAADYYNLVVKKSMPMDTGHKIWVAGDFTLNSGCDITNGQFIDVDGTSSIGGNITTSHDQTYTGAVTLTSDAVFVAGTAYSVTFGTVTGAAYNLTIGNGTTASKVSFGNNVTVKSVEVKGTTSISGNITTTGPQTYTQLVSLVSDVVLDAGTNIVTFSNGAQSSTATAQSLTIGTAAHASKFLISAGAAGKTTNPLNNFTVYGSTEFKDNTTLYASGDVDFKNTAIFRGDVQAASLTVGDTATIGMNTAKIVTTGAQDYKKTVKISTSAGHLDHAFVGSSVTFEGAVQNNGASYTPNLLIGDRGNNKTTNVTFKGNVSGMVNINVNGTATFDGATSVSTSENQTYEGLAVSAAVTLETTDSAKKITIKGDNTLAAALTIKGNTDFTGENTFADLKIGDGTQTSAYTINFATGKTQTINAITSKGNASNYVTLTTEGAGWTADLTGATTKTFEYTLVNKSTATPAQSFTPNTTKLYDYGVKNGGDATCTDWFAYLYKWTGANNTTDWTDHANWTDGAGNAVSEYPESTTGVSEILIPGGCTYYPEIAAGASYKLKSLETKATGTITLSDKNLALTGTATPLVNAGTIVFTAAGRITNAAVTPSPIMDNTQGTVEYDGTSGTITNYYTAVDTADYFNLSIKSGNWTLNSNIKAAGTFENAATLTMDTGAKIYSDFTNLAGGNIAGTSVSFGGACSTVEDKGASWDATAVFEGAGAIAFNTESATTAYKFNTASKTGGSVTFSGKNSTDLMQIASFTDAAASSKSKFNNVIFTNAVTLNGEIASGDTGNITFDADNTIVKNTFSITAGTLTFNGDSTLEKGASIDSAEKTITIASGKTVTTKDNFTITNGDLDLFGSIVCDGGTAATGDDKSLTVQNVNVKASAVLRAKEIKINGTITPDANGTRDITLTATTGSITVGSESNPNAIAIGTNALGFKNVTLETVANDITFAGQSNIKATDTVTVTGNRVTFSGAIIADKLVVNARTALTLQPGTPQAGDPTPTATAPATSLKANSLVVNGVSGSTPTITYSGTIDLSGGTDDFVIDHPVKINGHTHFKIGGNFILDNTATSTVGSLNPDTNGSYYVQITPGTGKTIQLNNDFAANGTRFERVIFNKPVVFNTAHTIYAGATDIATGCTSLTVTDASHPHYKISGSLIVRAPVTFPSDAIFEVPGSFYNRSTTSPVFPQNISVKGNFDDNGKWNVAQKIYLSGTNNQQKFTTTDSSLAYDIIVSKGTGTNNAVNFTSAITVDKFDVRTNSYKGKIIFSGTGDQTFKAENTYPYGEIEVNKAVFDPDTGVRTGASTGVLTITNKTAPDVDNQGTLLSKGLAITNGSVKFTNMDVTTTDAMNWATPDTVYISGGKAGDPVTFEAPGFHTISHIIPEDNNASYLYIDASAGGNINIGVDDRDASGHDPDNTNNADLGASGKAFESVVLNAGTSSGRTVHVSGQVWAQYYEIFCYKVSLSNEVHTWDLTIHASDIAINGLKTNSLSINPDSVNDPANPSIALGGKIELQKANTDFIIDYPLQVLQGTFYEADNVTEIANPPYDLVFNVNGNIIVKDNGASKGSVISNVNDSKRKVQFNVATGKKLIIQNGATTNAGLGNTNSRELGKVSFACNVDLSANTTVTSDIVSVENGITIAPETAGNDVTLTVKGAETKGLINEGTGIYNVNLAISAGDVNDLGTWNQTGKKIAFTGAAAQVFNGKAGTTYETVEINQANNTAATVELADGTGFNITNLTVLKSKKVTVNTAATVTYFTDNANASELEIAKNTVFTNIANTKADSSPETEELYTKKLTIDTGATFAVGAATPYKNLKHTADLTTVNGTLYGKDVTLAAVSIAGKIETTGRQTFTNTITLTGDSELEGTQLNLPANVNLDAAFSTHKLTLTSGDVQGTSITFAPEVIVSAQNTIVKVTGTATFNKALSGDTGYDFTVDGNAVFKSTVNSFKDFAVTGTTSINNTSITTAGTQTYSGDINITTAATLAASEVILNKPNAGPLTKQNVGSNGTALTLDTPKVTVSQYTEVFSTVGLLQSVEIAGTQGIRFTATTGTAGKDITVTGTAIFNGNTVNSPVINNDTVTCTNNVTFAEAYKTDTGKTGTFNASAGTVTFKKDVDFSRNTFVSNSGTIVLDPSGTDLTLGGTIATYNAVQIKGSVKIADTNTFATLTATELENKTITFPATSAKVQNVTTKLSLTGTADGDNKRLLLRSDSAAQAADTDCFYINFTGTADATNYSIKFVDMQNGYNARKDAGGNPDYLSVNNSLDSGNNYYWNFPGAVYTWTGSTDTDWYTPANWMPKSLPGLGAKVVISPAYTNGAGSSVTVTNFPSIDEPYITVGNASGLSGSITINDGAMIDFQDADVTAGTINNYGKVYSQGINTIVGTKVNSDVVNNWYGTVIYYGEGITTASWGENYYNLWFGDTVSTFTQLTATHKLSAGTISTKLDVTGNTVIKNNSANTETLALSSNQNNFAHGTTPVVNNPVEIASANENIELNSNGTLIIKENASSYSLAVTGNVTLNGNVTTTAAQTYNDDVILAADAILTVGTGSAITFEKNAGKSGSGNSDYVLTLDGNVIFGNDAKVNSKYLLPGLTKDSAWSLKNPAEVQNINIDTNIFCDFGTNGKTLTISDNLSCKNFVAYSGKISIAANKTLATAADCDFVAFGAAYSADDPRYSNADTRFAYYFPAEPDYKPAGATYADHLLTFTAQSTTLTAGTGSIIKTGNNFYVNGLALSGFTLQLNSPTANPALNTTDKATATQWGTPYAVVFNSTVTNVNADGNSNGTYLTAAVAQKNRDGNGNTNVQFKVPQIQKAYTVYDDVIYIAFNIPIENSNGDINANLAAGTNLATGGMYYNNKTLKFAGAYSDADCTTALTNADITTADSDGYYGFYVKTTNGKWNTDADGLHKWNTACTSSTEAQSTDRSGTHHDVTVDLSFLEGLFVAANGFTMSDNYGIGKQANGTTDAAAYTATEDKCAPVLLAVLTGKEKHINPAGNAATPASEVQQTYDGHNFIEFRYSEPVDTGTLLAAAGRMNVGATNDIGNLTMGTGITVNSLATLETGSVTAASKLGGTTPVHSLYRKFSNTQAATAEVQTHKVRLAIAGYVSGTISSNGKTYYNWTSYIENAVMPAGKVTRVPGGTQVKDKAGNPVTVVSTTNHPLAQLYVNKTASTDAGGNVVFTNIESDSLYNSWDVTPPAFAPLRYNGINLWTALKTPTDDTEYESVGAAYSGSSTLNAIEFHLFDNIPTYEAGETNQWFTKIGWASAVDTGDGKDLEVNGVAFTGEQAADVRGGIRYCTIYNLTNKFTYLRSGEAAVRNFDNAENISGGAESTLFVAPVNANSTGAEDGCYIKIPLTTGSGHDPKSEFKIYFNATDASVYVTDLAGNLLERKNYTLNTVNRSAPSLNITAAPCGKDEIYVVFSKAINIDKVTGYISQNNKTELDALEVIPTALKIVDASGAVATLQIDNSVRARVVHRSENSTGFIFKLTREITYADITGGLYIKVFKDNTYNYDPLAGITANVTLIQDMTGNYADAGKQHAFTDFAINVIEPEFAHNVNMLDSKGSELQFGLYSEGSWAVHSWGRDQGNYGTLNPDYDVFMKVQNPNDLTPTLYLSVDPTVNSVSYEYNRISGRDWRIWLPTISANIAPVANASTYSPAGTADAAEHTIDYDINIVSDAVNYSGYDAGSTITFLFDTGKTVDHDGPGVNQGPLYALRLADPNDVSSLDLWSIKLKSITAQRGGVSILNNVINPLNGEKAVVRLDMQKAGSVNIMVMTLDGNIVTYLNRGEVEAGEQFFTWDGRNTAGTVVARGMYFIRIVGNGIDETRKVMIVK